MRVNPIGYGPSVVYVPQLDSVRKNRELEAPSNVDLTPLLPTPPDSPKSLWDIVSPGSSPFSDLFDVLNNIVQTKLVSIQFNNTLSSSGDVDSGADYEKYLQFPNPKIQALSTNIVSPGDTNDKMMYKIEQWTIKNIEYRTDIEGYGISELWVFPKVTLEKGYGDCEDGAFLLHSLGLHAGVPSDRLRTYGGLVVTSDNIGVGGHAWTAYRREIDNQWINLDWCYWSTDKPISERQPMEADFKYIDDFFFVDSVKTVETPISNRVRFARSLFVDLSI